MARRRPVVPPWLLLFTAYAVLGLTWLMTTPPWASPDEPSALAKGISVTHGHLLGREPDYRFEASSFIENWYRQLTRTVDIPARQMPPALLPCYAFGAGQDASCLDKEPVAPFDLAPQELATHDPVTPELFDIRLLVARLGVEGTTAAPRAVPVTYL